ncbi:MAG: hypothetical protein JF887_00560 [Candidatus Dormibacteraeota bacterium]|uniref:DUF4367 domain-containing protein n=1 Tax=Candidatus Amunia macphersoniae TaxID=3127014 RepID=A0A934NFC2_9BACT|nr:hypothetical protein [Candidatus Dormibacteraeota bacterium]
MSRELEQQLAELGRRITYPPTPELASTVRARLSDRSPRRRVVKRWRVALVGIALAVLGAAFGVPPVRTAIAHWLGIQGVVITPVSSLPATRSPLPASTGPLGSTLSLGRSTSLSEARAAAGFPVAVPSGLGAPDAIYTRTDIGPAVSLVYAPSGGVPQSGQTGVGVLITEFRGTSNPMLMQKFVTPDTTITPLTVNGGTGFWIGGAGAHEVAYLLPDGNFVPDTLRLAGPTLVFERGDVTIRIEGSLSQAQALAIAQTLS